MADATGIVDAQNAEEANFTGFFFPYAGGGVPPGFLLCDGSAISRTTYSRLFGVIGTTYGAGNGATTFNLPDGRGRTFIGAGTGTSAASFNANSAVNTGTDQIAVPSNTWMVTGQAVVLAGSSLPTGLAAGTYYIIRIDATHIQLASSLANAQNGTAINITAVGSGTASLTQTLTTRARGDIGGEEAHATSLTELLSHNHPIPYAFTNQLPGGSSGTGYKNAGTSSDMGLTGGNAAMNNMQPFFVGNWMIKT